MRYLTIILVLGWLIACNDKPSTPSNAGTTTPAIPASNPVAQSTNSVVNADGFHKDAENPDIVITIQGLNSGAGRLIGSFTGNNFLVDEAPIDANGTMRFKKNTPYRSGLVYMVLPSNANFQILIDADQTFSMTTNINDIVGSMKVEGSKDNELLYQALQFESSQRGIFDRNAAERQKYPVGSPEYQKLTEERDTELAKRKNFLNGLFDSNPNSLFTKFKKGGQNPDAIDFRKPNGDLDTAKQVFYYRSQFWDNVDFGDTRLMYTPIIINKIKRYINELTPQHPDSIRYSSTALMNRVMNAPEYYKFFANWITLNYDPKESTLMDAQAVYVHMIQNYFTYDKAFWSDSVEVYGLQQRAHEMAASLVGLKGPDVISTDPSGKQRSIYDLKSPYIIVYMYNPDCEHCAVETPKLVTLYNQMKSQNLMDVYAIAIDTDDAKWRAYIQKNNMPWSSNVFDPTNRSIYAKYFVDITPEVYVLNPDRTIIGKNLNVDQIMTIINKDRAKRG